MTTSTKWNMYPAGTLPLPGRVLYPIPWVFAGRPCSIVEFADHIWPEPCADKTMFLLKWEGRTP